MNYRLSITLTAVLVATSTRAQAPLNSLEERRSAPNGSYFASQPEDSPRGMISMKASTA